MDDLFFTLNIIGFSFVGLLIGLTLILVWRQEQTRAYQKQFRGQAREIRRALAQTGQALTALTQKAEAYLPDEAEPYGMLAQTIHRSLASSRAGLGEQREQFRRVSGPPPGHPGGPLGRIWASLWSTPRYWQGCCGTGVTILANIRALQAEIDQGRLDLERLDQLPLEVAHQAQALQEMAGESLRLAEELAASGVHGDTLSSRRAEAKGLQQDLTAIPAYFLQDPDSTIREKANKRDVRRAWQAIQRLRPVLKKQLGMFRDWWASHQDIGQEIDRLELGIKETVALLGEAETMFEVAAYLKELKEAYDLTEAVRGEYPALTIEGLPDCERRVSRAGKIIDEVATKTKRYQQKFKQLQEAISRYLSLVAGIRIQMEQTARLTEYPIDWGDERWQINSLRRLEAGMEDLKNRQTPEQLDHYLPLAEEFIGKAQTMLKKVEDVVNYRAELVLLLQRPELAPKPAWQSRADRLQGQIQAYARSNWAKEERVTEIMSEAALLNGRREQLLPATSAGSLPAERLTLQLITEIRQLIDAVQAFQKRLQHLEETLAEIEAAERQAHQRFDETVQTVALLLDHWRRAKPGMALQHHHMLERLLKERRHLVKGFKRRRKVAVREQADRVEAWVAECLELIETLPPVFQAAIKEAEGELAEELSELRQVAPLDQEALIGEARRLLRNEHSSKASEVSDPDHLSQSEQMERRVDDLMAQIDAWESLSSTLEMVQSKISERIRGQREELERVSATASARVERLYRLWAEAGSDGSPATYDPRGAKDKLAMADEARRILSETGSTLAMVRLGLNKVIDYYKEAIIEADSKLERGR